MDDLEPRYQATFQSSNLDRIRSCLAGTFGGSLEFAGAPGRLDARLRSVALPHIQTMSLTFGADVVATLDPVDFLVQLPTAGSMLVRDQRGVWLATQHRMSVVSPSDPVAVTWRRDTAAIVFRFDRSAVQAELVDLMGAAGTAVDGPLQFQSTMEAATEPVRSWRATAQFVATALDAPGGVLDHPRVVADVERVLIRGLLLAQPHTYSARLAPARTRPPQVAAAVELLEARPAHPFTVVSLARMAGVSPRSLQEAFRAHLGMSPMQYLRAVRLRAVRADLLGLDTDDTTTVADVATRWGFTHLGRFAQYYRDRYGEPPSRTRRGA